MTKLSEIFKITWQNILTIHQSLTLKLCEMPQFLPKCTLFKFWWEMTRFLSRCTYTDLWQSMVKYRKLLTWLKTTVISRHAEI